MLTRITVYSFVPVLLSLAVPASSADLIEFLQRLEAYRRQNTHSAREWDTRRQQQYAGARRGEVPTNVSERDGFILPDREIPPGRYVVETPQGKQTIFVRPDSPNRGQAGPPRYSPKQRDRAELGHLVAQTRTAMRQVQHLADINGYNVWEDHAAEVLEELRDLEKAIVRGDQRDIGRQFNGFEQLWHPLAYQINNYPTPIPATLKNATRNASLHDELLHRRINVLKGPGYDRLSVIALSRQLYETVRAYRRQAAWDTTNGPYLLRRHLRRALRFAHDLADGVECNAPYQLVAGDYQDFDNEWHNFLTELRHQPVALADQTRTRRLVIQFDRELHRLLEMDAPEAGSHRQIHSQLRFAVHSSQQLAAAMASSRYRDTAIAQEARRLAGRLSTVEATYDEYGGLGANGRGRWIRTVLSWQTLQQAMLQAGLTRRNSPFADLFEDLQNDMTALQRSFAEGTSKDHPHHPHLH